MKIYVRYMGLILLEREIAPGEYVLGRGRDCDLPLVHENVSRRHARVYFDDGWYYEDLRGGTKKVYPEPQRLSDEKPIDMGHGIQLVTEQQLWEGNTEVSHIRDLASLSKELIWNRQRLIWLAAAFGGFLLLTALLRLHHLWKNPMDTNELLAFVRPKIVEFEHTRDPRLIDQLKKFANMKDEDFLDHAGFCTGFVVAPNVVLTAFHCIRGGVLAEINADFQIRTHGGELLKPTKVLGFDFKRDYLFLEVPGLDKIGHLSFSKKYTIGEKVYTVGNVGGEGTAIREGIMASTTEDPNDPKIEYIRYSAPASPGNSGGPLINAYGEIVGLVFARSMAENYNVGTAAEHLVEGQKKFVDRGEAKRATVNFDGYLDYNPEEMLLAFGLPYLPSWQNNQDYPRMFQSVGFDVEVPAPFERFAGVFVENCDRALRAKYQQILAQMSKAGEREGQWQDLYPADFKVFFAPDYFDNIGYNYRYKEMLPEQLSLHAPLGQQALRDYLKKFRQSEPATPPYETVVQPIDEDLAQRKAKPQFLYHAQTGAPKPLTYVPEILGRFVPRAFTKQPGEGRELKPAEVLENVMGEEGMLLNTYDVPFVRPKSQKDFRVKTLPVEPAIEKVADGLKREWTLMMWDALDQNVEVYCLPLPQGYICVSRNAFVRDRQLARISRRNFAEFYLTEYFVHTPFWRIDALRDFIAVTPAFPVWSDVELGTAKGGRTRVRFKTLGLEATVPADPARDMVRVVGGITKVAGEAAPRWVAFGLDHVRHAPTGLQWCSIAMEPVDQPGHPSLRSLRQAKGRKNVAQTRFDFKGGNFPVYAWSFCNPIEVKSETKPVSPKYAVQLPYEAQLSTP